MAPASKATGVEASLLPRHTEASEKRPSLHGAVFNVSTSIIGAGIMSIPATLKVLGVVPALIMIVLIGIVVDISVEFMLRFTYTGESRTYAGLVRESFGRLGSVAVQICVMMTNLGCLIMYLIIIGDVLSGTGPEHLGVLQEWFGIHWWNLRVVALLFIVLFVVLPLVLYRRVESLWLSSAVSVFLAVVFVGICSVMAIAALIEGETKTPRILPRLDNGVSFFNLFTAIPVIVTAFTFHFNGTNIDEFLFSRKRRLADDAYRFVLLSLALLALAYVLAVAIPSIWYLFQFMGSTSAVCLAFIFPGAVVLRDIHGISTARDKIIAAMMIIIAVITSTIAISTNIYKMVVKNSV
ncbi:hypothetical protein OROHE_014776 [Orobanche hederae]